MMCKNNKINKTQLAAILFNTIIGVGILSLPNVLAEQLGTGGWVSIILGGLIAIVMVAITTSVAIKYPAKSMVEFGRELVPKLIADIISAIYLFEFIVVGALVLRLTSQVVGSFILVRTPHHIIGATLLITVIYLVRSGIEPMGRMFIISTVLLIFPLILVGITILPDIELENFLPVFQFTAKDLLKSVGGTINSYSGFQILFFTLFFVKEDKKNIIKYNIGSTLSVIVIYTLIFLATLGKYGANKLKYQLWSVMSLMRSIQLPTAFVENIDIYVLSVWIITVFTTLASILFGASLVLSKLSGGKDQKLYVIPITVVVYLMAYIPRNVLQVYDYSGLVLNRTSIVTIFIVPLLYFILSKVKKRKVEDCSE